MNLYDEVIKETLKLIEAGCKIKKYSPKEAGFWEKEKEQKLIFKKDMAYELGGENLAAVSGVCFCNEPVAEDEIWVCGPGLSEIKTDSPYGRITILNVDDSEWEDSQKAYSSMQKIDYTRYHIYPKGFMIRISTSAKREPVRVSKKAIEEGLDFLKLGKIYIEEYHRHKEVKSVKIIFITEPAFAYEELAAQVKKMELITDSLNKIFDNLVMDCRVCNLKPVCDEVEGMRELHLSRSKTGE